MSSPNQMGERVFHSPVPFLATGEGCDLIPVWSGILSLLSAHSFPWDWSSLSCLSQCLHGMWLGQFTLCWPACTTHRGFGKPPCISRCNISYLHPLQSGSSAGIGPFSKMASQPVELHHWPLPLSNLPDTGLGLPACERVFEPALQGPHKDAKMSQLSIIITEGCQPLSGIPVQSQGHVGNIICVRITIVFHIVLTCIWKWKSIKFYRQWRRMFPLMQGMGRWWRSSHRQRNPCVFSLRFLSAFPHLLQLLLGNRYH